MFRIVEFVDKNQRASCVQWTPTMNLSNRCNFFVDFRFDFSICSRILSLFLVKNYFTKKVIYLAEDRVDAMNAGR